MNQLRRRPACKRKMFMVIFLDFEVFPEEAGDAEDCKTETPGSKAGSKIEGRP